MTRENAKKLQSMMAKEAVTLLMLGGAEADTAEHEEAIRLIGEAWGLAEEETARQIERIGHGRQSVRMGAENMPPDEGGRPAGTHRPGSHRAGKGIVRNSGPAQ